MRKPQIHQVFSLSLSCSFFFFCISWHVLNSVYCFSHSRNEHCCSTSTKKELSLDVLHMSRLQNTVGFECQFLSPLPHFHQAFWKTVLLSTRVGSPLFVFSILVGQWQMVLWASGMCTEEGFYCHFSDRMRFLWGQRCKDILSLEAD